MMRPYPLKGVAPLQLRSSTALCASGARLRPFHRPYPWAQAVRRMNLEAGDDESGHIKAGPHQGIIFFDNIYPLRLQWLFGLPWQSEQPLPSIVERLQNPAASDPAGIIDEIRKAGMSIEVSEVLPRYKEGGAFVKFSYGPNATLDQIEEALRKYLKEHTTRPWWSPFSRVGANVVRGKPWVEDLFRLPSSRLKVEFLPPHPGDQPVELTQEELYSYFRPYGKLTEITPQPSDSKVVPRYAVLDFASKSKAIMAKNCLHGFIVGEAEGGGKAGTVLRLTYERKVKAHWIRDWLTNHPRIVIPAVAALVAGISVVIFDPLRTFFVKAHVTHQFSITDNRVVRWFISRASNILSFRHRRSEQDPGMEAIWDEQKDNIEQIKTWLMETDETFIIVQGPRGSGKREIVVDQALKHRRNTLVIDCKPIQEARGDSATINAAAAEVGYRPVFSWMNSISGLIDLVAQGTAGMKTGFSETVDSQLAKIWNNTAAALKDIALEGRKKDDKDAHLNDDEWLESHPERRPVVVIDNFLHKSQEGSIVYDKIAEWAARVTTANIAHIIFLTTDVSFSKSLSKALPDRIFREISLNDCTPEVAKRYVITQLDADPDDSIEEDGKKLTPSQRRRDLVELDECISHLGGRLTDLEFLARRIKIGETPKRAVQAIIEQSASEILKMYLLGNDDSERKWSPEQAWLLIKRMAEGGNLRYNEILLTDMYKSSGETALQALEQAELISIVSSNGRPYCIKPSKPIYLSAFRYLVKDSVLTSRLDLQILTQMIKNENASIEKYENELKLLSDLKKQPSELTDRIKWLLGKVMSSQKKVENYEKESSQLQQVLLSEF